MEHQEKTQQDKTCIEILAPAVSLGQALFSLSLGFSHVENRRQAIHGGTDTIVATDSNDYVKTAGILIRRMHPSVMLKIT